MAASLQLTSYAAQCSSGKLSSCLNVSDFCARGIRRRYSTSHGIIEAGDIVLLRRSDKPFQPPILTKPLQRGETVQSHLGTLRHDDIIGKKIREVVQPSSSSRKMSFYRIHKPTLAEYVTLSPRLVTPIYPADANLIVSLLDIHVTPTDDSKLSEGPQLEILEAGTGHGALTLHLARAIHAANGPARPVLSVLDVPLADDILVADDTSKANVGPKNNSFQDVAATEDTEKNTEVIRDDEPLEGDVKLTRAEAAANKRAVTKMERRAERLTRREVKRQQRIANGNEEDGKHQSSEDQAQIEYEAELLEWKRGRGAVVHTLDLVRKHSAHAEKVVSGFRKGLYAGNVDFHVGDISGFIERQCKDRNTEGQIFHHIFLDLPGVHNHIISAARALRDDGVLAVFAPSVTQITRCVEVLRKNKLPLAYEQVIELGPGYSGGKQWDVRAVKPMNSRSSVPRESEAPKVPPRSSQKPGATAQRTMFQNMSEFVRNLFGAGLSQQARPVGDLEAVDEWVMVCRPSVGRRSVGGGFVGVWRRKKDWESRSQIEEERGDQEVETEENESNDSPTRRALHTGPS